jgi:hypothetical protein
VHAVVIKRELVRPRRRGARGDEDDVAAQQCFTRVAAADAHGVGVHESRGALEPPDAQFVEPRADAVSLPGAHLVRVAHEVFDGRLAAEREVDAEQLSGPPAGQRQRRFTQRFAGDGAGVDARAAQLGKPLDQRDALAEDGGGGRARRARGPAPDHNQVETGGVHANTPARGAGPTSPAVAPGAGTPGVSDSGGVISIGGSNPRRTIL